MAEDPLLKALMDTARETDPRADPRWEALAEGTLSAEDEAALAELARRSEAHRMLFEAFRPLDDGARGRIAGTLVAGMEARRPAPIPLRPRQRTRWVWALAAAAVLAGGLWVAIGRPSGDGSLPAYAMTVTSGERDVRALPATPVEVPRIGPGSRIAFVLRPASGVQGAVATRAFLLQNGRARVLEAPAEVAETGAVRIEGTREALFAGVPAGRWEVIVAVGRPGALPSAEQVASGAPAPEGCRVARQEILLLEGDSGAHP